MKQHKLSYNIRYLLVAIFIFYFLQGILYPEGTIISQAIIALWILIGVFYYGKAAIYRHKPAVITWLILFYAMQVLCFIFSPKTVIGTLYEAIGEVPTLNQLKDISVFVLSLMVMYVSARKSGGFSEASVRYICYALFILSIFRFFYEQEIQQAIKEQERVTNNIAYFFVALLPYMPYVLKKSKLIGGLLSVVIIAFVMFAAKRGAIITMVVSLLFSVYYYIKNSEPSIKNMLVTFAVLVAMVGGLYYAFISNEWLLYRIENMEVEGVGGRGIAYSVLFNHWYSDMNFWTLMFGNGMSQTVVVWGNYAHNDWLELLINNGVVGVVVYLMVFITAFRYIHRAKLSTESRLAANLCLIIWLAQTMYSMGYASISNSIYTMLLGMIMGSVKYKIKPKKQSAYNYETSALLD